MNLRTTFATFWYRSNLIRMAANPSLERCRWKYFIKGLFHSIHVIAKSESGKDFWKFIILLLVDVWIVY